MTRERGRGQGLVRRAAHAASRGGRHTAHSAQAAKPARGAARRGLAAQSQSTAVQDPPAGKPSLAGRPPGRATLRRRRPCPAGCHRSPTPPKRAGNRRRLLCCVFPRAGSGEAAGAPPRLRTAAASWRAGGRRAAGRTLADAGVGRAPRRSPRPSPSGRARRARRAPAHASRCRGPRPRPPLAAVRLVRGRASCRGVPHGGACESQSESTPIFPANKSGAALAT